MFMSIAPVISLKRNYHKEFKIGGESFMPHKFIAEVFTDKNRK